MLTDNVTGFNAKFLLQDQKLLGLKHQFLSTYHPHANGHPERFNRMILPALRRLVTDHTEDWILYADAVTYAFEPKADTAIGLSPFELNLRRVFLHLT